MLTDVLLLIASAAAVPARQGRLGHLVRGLLRGTALRAVERRASRPRMWLAPDALGVVGPATPLATTCANTRGRERMRMNTVN